MRDADGIGVGAKHAALLPSVACAQDCASIESLEWTLQVQQRSVFIRNTSERPCIVDQVEPGAR